MTTTAHRRRQSPAASPAKEGVRDTAPASPAAADRRIHETPFLSPTALNATSSPPSSSLMQESIEAPSESLATPSFLSSGHDEACSTASKSTLTSRRKMCSSPSTSRTPSSLTFASPMIRGGSSPWFSPVAAMSNGSPRKVNVSPLSYSPKVKRKRRNQTKGYQRITALALGMLIISVTVASLLFVGITTSWQTDAANASASASPGWMRSWFRLSSSTSTPNPTTAPVKLAPLPVPGVDVSVSKEDFPMIHIVNTRFMQDQGHLVTLARARLWLFRTFCLPTMLKQSASKKSFLWIIKTDPNLDETVRNELLADLAPHRHFYLVGSNVNYLIHPSHLGAWRDGAEGRDLMTADAAGRIYSGDRNRLLQAIALRNERPILETRLDADDGLHKYYIEYLQLIAYQRFGTNNANGDEGVSDGNDNSTELEVDENELAPAKDTTSSPPVRWLYWCSRRHMEWHPSGSQEDLKFVKHNKTAIQSGILVPIQHNHLCITPGITVGYNVGTPAGDVPVHPHDALYLKLHNATNCYAGEAHTDGKKQKSCLELVDDLSFCAIRSRTLTSAGMLGLKVKQQGLSLIKKKPKMAAQLWQLLKMRFSVDPKMAEQTQSFLVENSRQIAKENLAGQCTSGHSCKPGARQQLKAAMKG